MSSFVTSRHGVECVESHSGNHWGQIKVLVPICCLTCSHYDSGEYGDYGSLLSGPECTKNQIFPTRKGACRVHSKPELAFRTSAEFDAYFEAEFAQMEHEFAEVTP